VRWQSFVSAHVTVASEILGSGVVHSAVKIDSQKSDVIPLASTTVPTAGPDDFRAGTIIAGRYLVMERIAAGGMGEVFLAYDLKFESLLAEANERPER